MSAKWTKYVNGYGQRFIAPTKLREPGAAYAEAILTIDDNAGDEQTRDDLAHLLVDCLNDKHWTQEDR